MKYPNGVKAAWNKSSTHAPNAADPKHCHIVHEKFSNIGKNIMKQKIEKIRLSTNCPMNVETYERMMNANIPSGFFLKILPTKKLRTLFTIAETINAMEEERRIYHVPPKI